LQHAIPLLRIQIAHAIHKRTRRANTDLLSRPQRRSRFIFIRPLIKIVRSRRRLMLGTWRMLRRIPGLMRSLTRRRTICRLRWRSRRRCLRPLRRMTLRRPRPSASHSCAERYRVDQRHCHPPELESFSHVIPGL
jgi:hypothetical protein